MSTQVFLAGPSYRETYYAMGSARAQSPGPIGAIGLNGAWLINASDKLLPQSVQRYCLSSLHIIKKGNLDILTALNILPETRSAVVVLLSTLALVDTANQTGQMLLVVVLSVPK